MTSSQISRVTDGALDAGQEPEDLVTAGATAGAELEPAVGEVVEHRDPLGDLRRVVHLRQRVVDARPDVDALGGVGEVPADDVVRRHVRVLVEEVVLGDPDVLEAGLVGRLGDRHVVHEHLVLCLVGVVAPPERRVVALDEDAEFHCVFPPMGRQIVPRLDGSASRRPAPRWRNGSAAWRGRSCDGDRRGRADEACGKLGRAAIETATRGW